MPIVDGVYQSPNWNNGGPPAINAEELNAISESIVTGIPADYQDIQAGESISFLDPVNIVGGKAVKATKQVFDYIGTTPTISDSYIDYSYVINNSTIIVCSHDNNRTTSKLTLYKLSNNNWNAVSSISYETVSGGSGSRYFNNSPVGSISQLSSTVFAIPYFNHVISNNYNNLYIATFSVSGNSITKITEKFLQQISASSSYVVRCLTQSCIVSNTGVFILGATAEDRYSFYTTVLPFMCWINFSTGAITASAVGAATQSSVSISCLPAVISTSSTSVMAIYTTFSTGSIDWPATVIYTIGSSTVTAGSQQGLSTEFGYKIGTAFNLTKNASGQVCGFFTYNSGTSSNIVRSGVVCRFNSNGTIAARTNYIGEDIGFFQIQNKYNYSYQNTQNVMAFNDYMYSLNLPVNGTPSRTQTSVKVMSILSVANMAFDVASNCLSVSTEYNSSIFNLENKNVSTQAIALKAATNGAQTRVIYDGIWYDTNIPINTSIYTDGVSAYSPIAGKLCVTGKPSSQISTNTYVGNGGVMRINTTFMPDLVKIWAVGASNYTYIGTVYRGGFCDFVSSASTGSNTVVLKFLGAEIKEDGFITSGSTNENGTVYQYWAYKY